MKHGMVLLGGKIVDITKHLFGHIKEFWNEASARCKAYTIGVFVLLIIFVVIDICEYRLNSKAKVEVQNTANAVFDPIIKEIENMDTQTQHIMEPIKYMFIKLKPWWIKLATLLASLIIGLFVEKIKTPVKGIKDIISNIIYEVKDEPKMWLPFWLLTVIDIIEFILTFS